eukprot:s14741_g1.t1
MFQQGAQKHGCSYSLVFLDLREAFYRVIRPLFTGSRFNDEDYAKVAATLRLAPDTLAILYRHLQEDSLATLRLAPDTLAILYRHLQEDSLPQIAGASDWVAMSLSEILDCTWFRFRRCETVVETGVGSRPGDNCADLVFSYLFACVLRDIRSDLHAEDVLTVGDNCADLVFSYLFACVLRDIRSDLHAEDVLTVIPWAENLQGRLQPASEGDLPTSVLPLLDSTWMDDLAIMLMAPTAVALPEVTAPASEGDLPTSVLPLLDSTWMDDLAIMLMAPTAVALPEVTAQATRSLVDHCMGRGLIPNLARGKTEII